MELRFLGQTYATANHRVPTVATENTAHFWDKVIQFVVPFKVLNRNSVSENIVVSLMVLNK